MSESLLQLPPELLYEVVYILIIDYVHALYEQVVNPRTMWNPVTILPGVCHILRIISLDAVSKAFDIPLTDDGCLSRNPYPAIRALIERCEASLKPIDRFSLRDTVARLFTADDEFGVPTQSHHGLLGAYDIAARLRVCNNMVVFCLRDLRKEPDTAVELHDLLNGFIQLLMRQLDSLKPERLGEAIDDVLITECFGYLLVMPVITVRDRLSFVVSALKRKGTSLSSKAEKQLHGLTAIVLVDILKVLNTGSLSAHVMRDTNIDQALYAALPLIPSENTQASDGTVIPWRDTHSELEKLCGTFKEILAKDLAAKIKLWFSHPSSRAQLGALDAAVGHRGAVTDW